MSWQATSSDTASGNGTTFLASARKNAAQVASAPPMVTRWPTARWVTPWPSASTTPTASVPGTAGSGGL